MVVIPLLTFCSMIGRKESSLLGLEVGRVGEIAPRVLKNWKIKVPVVACEMGIGFLG